LKFLLYNSPPSTCSQRVRFVLNAKRLPFEEKKLDLLAGDQLRPEYLALNPNGVVPTLVHDGKVVIESSVILYYLDEVFPSPALMPRDPLARAQVRMVNKLIDEYVHNSCTILTFATAFRPWFAWGPRRDRGRRASEPKGPAGRHHAATGQSKCGERRPRR